MARGPRGSLSMGSVPEGMRMKTTPIRVPRTRRVLNLRGLTSLPAGKVIPVCCFALLREDALASCRLQFQFELYETEEVLANPVLLNMRAYLVPNLAFARFNGSIDSLNRSYSGEAEPGGSTVIPFFNESTVAPGALDVENQILYYLGSHVAEGAAYNAAYHEAYNVAWNFRAQNRSPDIPVIPESNMKLQPAYWRHPDLGHIVPDFDQASIEGEVPLTIVDGRMHVRGLATSGAIQTTTSFSGRQSDNITAEGSGWTVVPTAPVATQTNLMVQANSEFSAAGIPEIFAEMQENGVTVSLANIGLAARTKAFALARKQYSGLSDDYIIDMLMSGIRMPTEAEKQPHLLANVMTMFGQGKRYATDSVDLTASVSSGAAAVRMNLRTPPINTGGVVIVTCEYYPEQLWERREDPYLSLRQVNVPHNVLPDFLRDTLDPEKVDIVTCKRVDVRHSTPGATFGYEPLNGKWTSMPPRVGGKFYRPEVDLPADEDRARIWASETVDPTLSRDFYLVTSLHTKPFVVTDQDTAEVLVKGMATITGNTVFGNPLIAASDDYNIIMEDAPLDTIDKKPIAGGSPGAEEPETKEEAKS